MPTLVVDVKHLDGVVGELGVGPSRAELAMWAPDDVDKLFGSQARLSLQRDEPTFPKSLKFEQIIFFNFAKMTSTFLLEKNTY